jgi:peptidoglycan hydrolase CwlO-like protein
MLPSSYATRLAARLKAVRAGKLPEQTALSPDLLTANDILFSLQRAFKNNAQDARRVLEASRQVTSSRRDPLLEMLVLETVLDHALGCCAALRAHDSSVPHALLQAILEPAQIAACREAVGDRMRAMRALYFPKPVAELLAAHQSAVVSREDQTLADRMRAAQSLGDVYRLLMAVNVSPEVMAETLKQLQALPLGRHTLPVILAHIFPLTRKTRCADVVALMLLANLRRWMEELARLRENWVARSREEEHLPDVSAALASGHSSGLYSLYLNRLLRQIVEAKPGDDTVRLPDVVHFEKAFNEVADPLSRRAVEIWCPVPLVAAQLLRLLAEMGSMRLQVVRILERTLWAEPWLAEAVQLAAIQFAQAFLSGFSAEEAHLSRKTVVIQKGDSHFAELDDEVKTILESDTNVRRQLEQVSKDPQRPPQVRVEALLALFRAAPSEPEVRRIAAQAVSGDVAQVEALLRYVAEQRAHTAFGEIEMLESQLATFPPKLRTLYFTAVAAGGHARAPSLLRKHILAHDNEAEEALRTMGAQGALDQILAERNIRQNVREANELDKQRDIELRVASDRFVESASHSSQTDIASVEVTRWGAVSRGIALEHMLSDADVQLQYVALTQRLRELLARVPDLEGRIKALVSEVGALESQISHLEREIARATATIRESESTVGNEQTSIQRLQSELQRATARHHSAVERRRSAENELNTLRGRSANTEAEIQSLQSRIHSASQEAGRWAREEAGLHARMATIPHEIEAHRRNIRILQDNITELERRVEALRRSLGGLNRQTLQVRGRITLSEEELRALRQQIVELQSAIRRVSQESEQLAANYRNRLQTAQHNQNMHLAAFQREMQQASTALSAAQEHQGQARTLQTEIQSREQQNADLLAAQSANQEHSAEQLGELDHRATATETERVRTLRLRQEVTLNVDLLMAMLKCIMGFTPEVQRVLVRLEN